MFCDLSLASFATVTNGISVVVTDIPAIDDDLVDRDACDDDDDCNAVDTVNDGATDGVDVDDDDFDNAADSGYEIKKKNDIVVFDDVTDKHGVIVLNNDNSDNSDDDTGVVC